MKKTLLTILFCFAVVLLPVVCPAQEQHQGSFGIVSAPLANVHAEPAPKSGLATQVLMGEEVRVLEKRDNRYRILIPGQEGREGWVQQEAVMLPKDQGRGFQNMNRQWIVVTTPKADALILDKTGNHRVSLYAGTRLPVREKTSEGYTVLFPDRSRAIINASEVMPVKTIDPLLNDTKPEEIAGTSAQFQGARQLAGGMTVQGMDTNGLIYISYRIHGIPVGADIASFAKYGYRVPKKDLKSGDILVFSGDNAGLYLGGGRFLHAARKKTVKSDGLSDRRFAKTLQYGIRVIGAGAGENKRVAEMAAEDVLLAQARAARLPLGGRIAYWAGRFLGTPYDPDPLGLYVRTNRIVADAKVDCMYHVFRSVELAQSATPREAVDKALTLRFINKGTQRDGLVANYDERFQYGEDMVFSGKWGKNVTAQLGATSVVPGSRGRETVDILPKDVLLTSRLQKKLVDGDIVYWVKDPARRVVGEIVAHLSVIRIKAGKAYVVHASGDKDRPGRPGGGVVKEVPFSDYVRSTRFIGAFVTRFE